MRGESEPRPPAKQDAWARAKLLEVRNLCAKHHGHAFDGYASFLVEHRATLRGEIEHHMGEFLDSLGQKPQSGALQHAARNFAIMFAGAALAQKAGLANAWKRSDVLNDLKLCFQAGLDEIKRIETVEERARTKLFSQLDGVGPLSSKSGGDGVEAWTQQSSRGAIFVVKTTTFASWFDDALELRAALRWLLASKLLLLKDQAQEAFPNLEWAVTFHKPFGTTMRCYQFRDPTRYP